MSADADANANNDAKLTKKESKSSSDDKGFDPNSTVTIETIRSLREEAKNHRLQKEAKENEFNAFKDEAHAKFKEFEIEKTNLSNKVEKLTAYEKRLIDSEIKAELILAGIKDLELAKLIDSSDLKVSEDGLIDNSAIKGKVSTLKESKPFLFGEDKKTSTSTGAKIEKKEGEKKKNVLDSDDQEWQKQRRDFLNKPVR
jgi:hypothetical protein